MVFASAERKEFPAADGAILSASSKNFYRCRFRHAWPTLEKFEFLVQGRRLEISGYSFYLWILVNLLLKLPSVTFPHYRWGFCNSHLSFSLHVYTDIAPRHLSAFPVDDVLWTTLTILYPSIPVPTSSVVTQIRNWWCILAPNVPL